MQKLTIETFPLHGQQLIEASAGTGKTYTIAGLYNRLILGHEHPPLDCNQILVVTFTNAATEELRGRLRARIQDTLQQLLQLQHGVSSQDNEELSRLENYLAQIPSQDVEKLQQRLQLNLSLMDEASIFTIHSFCQRMLKRFAFDTGVMFSAELVMESNAFLLKACEDVWRQAVYGLDAAQTQAIIRHYPTPEALLSAVRSRFSQQGVQVLPKLKAPDFASAWQAFEQAFSHVQQLFEQCTEGEIPQLIINSAFKSTYQARWLLGTEKNNFNGWWPQVAAYLSSAPDVSYPDNLYRFSQNHLDALAAEKSLTPIKHPLFTAVDELTAAIEQLQAFLRAAWYEPIKERFFTLLNRASSITNDDLMRLLSQALTSPQGQALAEQIRALYPIALIDEFQDTDALQYQIFNTIYPPLETPEAVAALEKETEEETEKASHALIMIGDPKQAIYSFRGADIFTYIKAKQALPASACFTLGTNFRSHSQLVAGVNQLFEQHPEPFVFDEDIPFQAVDAGGFHDGKAFHVGGQAQQPLQLFFNNEITSPDASRDLAAEQCAEKIAELLQGDATLGSKANGKPVAARDIAVLIRNESQALKMQQALRKQGVNSVFLNRRSVFKSEEAQDLYRWLLAIAHPNNERNLRVALASGLQGLAADDLAKILVDELAWEQQLERNAQYHELWLKRGIMAAIMRWLEQDNLAQRIRQQHQGERKLTNLMHLGDLLQAQSRKLAGHEALLHWLGERIHGDQHSGEETQLRLESDADLVTIITIHRSKGLQYPLVFLPFVWDDANALKKNDGCIYYDRKTQQVILHLAPEEMHNKLAQDAKTAENMRLLYVALTRAEQGCFVWLMNNISHNKTAADKSALGRLLQIKPADAGLDVPELSARLANLSLYFGPVPQWRSQPRQAQFELNNAPAAQQLTRAHYDQWRVSSYSALAANNSLGAQFEQELPQELPVLLKDDEGASAAELQPLDSDAIALTFPKGTQPGSCLHDVLELWDFQTAEALPTLCKKSLDYYGIALPETRLPDLAQWFQAMVATPLRNAQGEEFSLAQLAPSSRLSEMEFHLPVQQLLTPNELERLLGSSGRFSFMPMTGFLKGFIDLTFEHNGRYYVADYKSNFLGLNASDYLDESLQRAMHEHAYDLQAWIYTLALDALLRLRLGESYQPQQHLGGVYYLFLRGMHLSEQQRESLNLAAGTQAPGVYFQPVDSARLEQWRAAFFNSQEVGA